MAREGLAAKQKPAESVAKPDLMQEGEGEPFEGEGVTSANQPGFDPVTMDFWNNNLRNYQNKRLVTQVIFFQNKIS